MRTLIDTHEQLKAWHGVACLQSIRKYDLTELMHGNAEH